MANKTNERTQKKKREGERKRADSFCNIKEKIILVRFAIYIYI